MSDRTPIFAQHETWEDIVAGLRAENERLTKYVATWQARHTQDVSAVLELKEQAEAALAEHLASHLCLLKHGADEPIPSKKVAYVFHLTDEFLPWVVDDRYPTGLEILEYYGPLPERSAE
jgi:hypothetical protein